MASIEGDLTLMPLADLCIWMANRELSGSLTIERGSTRLDFDIDAGGVVRAASNDPRQYFGQFLLHFQLVTDAQLQQAYDSQREAGVRLGHTLTAIGLVPEPDVVACLRVKITETLQDALRWTEGRFRLTEVRAAPAASELSVSVPLIDLHTEAHARGPVWAEYERLFPDQTMRVQVQSAAPRSGADATFRERVLTLAGRGASVEALLLETHASDFILARELVELHRLGWIAPSEPSVAILPPALTVPSTGQSHLDLAQTALDEQRFGDALEHARAQAAQRPGDPRVQAVMSRLDAVAGEAEQPHRDAVPTLTGATDADEVRALTAKERYVLGRVDGRRSVQAIMQISPMHEVEALDILRRFQERGWIAFEGAGQSDRSSVP